MATWPSIMIPQYGTDGEHYLPLIESEKEAPYISSRPAFGGNGKMWWNLRWDAMPEADFQTFITFVNTNKGQAIDWTEPVTGTARVVCFVGDSIKWSHADKGRRSVTCTIREV